MSTKPSFWWPTPSDPHRWFDEVDLGPRGRRPRWPVLGHPSRGTPDETVVPDGAVVIEFRELAKRFDVPVVGFAVDPAIPDTNANITSEDTLTVSVGLLRQPAPIRDWLIGHELAHLKLGHPRRAAWVEGVARSVGVLLAVLVGLSLAGVMARPYAVVGVAGLLGLWLGVRFYRRYLEREADWEAARLVQRPDIRDLRALYVMGSARLDPPLPTRLASSHPSPAERLGFLSRL